MRLCKLIGSAGWMLLFGVCAALPAQATAALDAPPKHRLCQPCTLPQLPIALPRKGLVFNYDSVMSSVSPWYVVDFDRGEATRILARRYVDRGLPGLAVIEQTTRALPSHELARLTQVNTEIWALQDRLPAQLAAEVSWQLWLLDGGDVRHELEAGVPNGPSKEILLMMQRVLERPAPSD
jgi:hypothetical protein